MNLTTKVTRSFEENKAIVRMCAQSFYDAGKALVEIRDKEQYKDTHDTFEKFCSDEWGFSRARIYQVIDAALAMDDLAADSFVSKKLDTQMKKIGGKEQILLPKNEAQARAVACASSDPKIRGRVWIAASETAPKAADGTPKVTASLVKKVAAEIISPKPREPGEDKPEPQHVSPPPDTSTPFDGPLAECDWVLNVAVPQVQEKASSIEGVLGASCGLSPSKVSSLMKQIHDQFSAVRGVIAHAQKKHQRKSA